MILNRFHRRSVQPFALAGVVCLAFVLAGCGDGPLPGSEVLEEVEPGTPQAEVLALLPAGPGVDEGQRMERGYKEDRFFTDGTNVHVVWMRDGSSDPLVDLPRSRVNPIVFRDGVLDGWGWDHFDDRAEGWGLPDRTQPEPEADADTGADSRRDPDSDAGQQDPEDVEGDS